MRMPTWSSSSAWITSLMRAGTRNFTELPILTRRVVIRTVRPVETTRRATVTSVLGTRPRSLGVVMYMAAGPERLAMPMKK